MVRLQRFICLMEILEVNMNKIIDPKNPHTVGKSFANLGNHVLIAGFIGAIIFVVVASYG